MNAAKPFPIVCLLVILGVTPLFGENQANVDTTYLTSIQEWRQERLAGLKTKDGWLSLAGLFWLKEGANTFGGGTGNDMVITDVKAPDLIGTFTMDKGQITFKTAPGKKVLNEGVPVSRTLMVPDQDQKPTTLTYGTITFWVIKRAERLGVRLRDSENPRIGQLTKIDSFPLDPTWRIPARWVPFEKPEKIQITNVIGSTFEETVTGKLLFTLDGKEYSFWPMGDGDEFFVVFGDQTNGSETYGGGRFLSVDKADEQGRMVIDFNMAYNPPCVFSPFATCPLPPEVNIMPIRVTAGEKIDRGPDGND